jgi:hypothetical protein
MSLFLQRECGVSVKRWERTFPVGFVPVFAQLLDFLNPNQGLFEFGFLGDMNLGLAVPVRADLFHFGGLKS